MTATEAVVGAPVVIVLPNSPMFGQGGHIVKGPRKGPAYEWVLVDVARNTARDAPVPDCFGKHWFKLCELDAAGGG